MITCQGLHLRVVPGSGYVEAYDDARGRFILHDCSRAACATASPGAECECLCGCDYCGES